MSHRSHSRILFALGVVGLVSAVAPSGAGRVGAALERGAASGFAASDQSPQPPGVRGATTTRLADGRLLVVGGEGVDGAVATAKLIDPRTGLATPLPALQVGRSGHTATLLADGSVLIAGGRVRGGQPLAAADLFDPQSNTFQPITVQGAQARADHTATVLTDGRVLMAGGYGTDGAPAGAEIWDVVQATSARQVGAMTQARGKHEAELLADGRVRIGRGVGADGAAVANEEIFDPITGFFTPAPRRQADQSPLRLAASLPETGAIDVPLDARIALRFSHPLFPDSVNVGSIIMSGPDGPVDVGLVPAEQGRLVFVTPRLTLNPSTQYVLTIAGIVDRRDTVMPLTSVMLTTRDGDQPATVPDQEAWAPDGASWRSQRGESPWQLLKPLRAAPGVTALAGQVLKLDGRPLANVMLAMEGHRARTDGTGRFLLALEGITTGEHTFDIDASTANRPGRTYGFYEVRWKIQAGQTTVLPFTIWSPLIDTAHQVTIPVPTVRETVITTPTMPGLELHVPAGTTIVDEDGHVVRTVSLTPIPLDRTPFPLPEGVPFTMFFTIQPGGAYLRTTGSIRGGWLVYPRRTDHVVGAKLRFFNYDPDDKGWYAYGLGTVTETHVVPDPGTRIYAFTGASFDSGVTPPAGGATPGGGRDGDPVDPSTGAFIMEKTDLYLPDVMPLSLTRTYNSLDNNPASARPFGIGMTHGYGLFQWSGQQFDQGNLYLPDGGRIHFTRVSDPNGAWFTTVMECQETPTAFYKARLRFDGNAWEYTLKDGTVYIMGHFAQLQRIRDRYGNETRLTWSDTNLFGAGTGNLLRITSPNGRWIGFTYDTNYPVNRITDATDNIGRNVHYTYDANGHLSTVTDPEGNVTTYTWDANHRMTTIKDGRNIVYLTNHYDANGRVDKQTLADPTVSYAFAYTTDGSGNITQTDVTNPRGYTKRLSYSSSHYLTSQIEALGQPEQRTTTIDRVGGSNFVGALVDGLTHRVEYTYDDYGHVRTVKQLAETASPVTTTYTYDPVLFQLASVTDPLSHTWTVGFDEQARPVSVTDPLNHQTTFAMNVQGRVTGVSDPLQHTWTFAYSGADQTSRADPAGGAWRTFFDDAGRALSTSDPLGQTTRYTVDKLNRLRTVTNPGGGVTSLDYDPTGRLVARVDPLSHASSYVYDTIDRALTSIDALQNRQEYLFNKNGNLAQTIDRKGQLTTYEYDALDRLKLVTYADASTVQYVYDAADRVQQIVDSVAGTITRGYDSLGRLTSESSPGRSITYTYSLDGLRQTMTVAGQPVVTYGYDDAHRLVTITQGSRTVLLTYDAADRRSTLTLPNGVVTTYTYDQANQLTALTYTLGQTTLGTLTYSYDAAGQRTSAGGSWARTGLPRAMAGAAYDAANRLTTWSGTTFDYDANGSVISRGLTGYQWDARGQLTGLTGAASASFAYDGSGRRITTTEPTGTREYLYDGADVVLESGARGTVSFIAGGSVDEWLTRTDAGGTVGLLADALGSTIAAFGESGTEIGEKEYEPFGGAREFGDSERHGRFTGREQDESGLYYYRARYYDPEAARFLSEDPAGPDAFGNAYAYVEDGPTNAVDPTGLTNVEVCCRPLQRRILGMQLIRFFKHCYIKVTFEGGREQTYGVLGDRGSTKNQIPRTGDDRNSGGNCKDVPGTECQKNKLIEGLERAVREGTCPSCGENYDALRAGPDLVHLIDGYNSNTFVYNMLLGAGMVPPGMGRAPGYHPAPGQWYP